MSEHREWNERVYLDESITALRNEHNATVRAYRDAMAECERLGKANDEACDRIAELEREWQHAKDNCHDGIEYTESLKKDFFEMEEKLKALESRPVLTWEECADSICVIRERKGTGEAQDFSDFRDWLKSRLPAPTDSIRVPFSEAQIERMAKAACESWHGLPSYAIYDDTGKQEWRDSIRAALAAGGLVPCAVPEYKPEDVALRPERASDEELCDRIRELENNLIRVSAKSARRRAALKALNRTVASQSDLIQRFLRAGKEPVPPNHIVDANKMVPERASDEELYQVFERGCEGGALLDIEGIRAVRARVEAPLLAEIERLNGMYGLSYAQSITAERDTLKARVAELGGVLINERADLRAQRDKARAELEAVKAERDRLHEPTGWELDVTAEELSELINDCHQRNVLAGPRILDLCRSRIRPTFECAECAKSQEVGMKAVGKLDAVRSLLSAARAAMEGE